MSFDPDCKKCPRLAKFLKDLRTEYPSYYCRPVPPFGASNPDLLIVGLAPGMHGANASGRPFTGDHAGILLYQTLFEYGFSNKPVSESANDKLKLRKCRITNAVKCLPPQNKPTTGEINTCNRFLADELSRLKQGAVILALGNIAHRSVIKAFGEKQSAFPFGHGKKHVVSGYRLVDSYHCSRYNTQTRRLTTSMFRNVFRNIRQMIDQNRE
jgi:uracil-DNA glycosylase family 4